MQTLLGLINSSWISNSHCTPAISFCHCIDSKCKDSWNINFVREGWMCWDTLEKVGELKPGPSKMALLDPKHLPIRKLHTFSPRQGKSDIIMFHEASKLEERWWLNLLLKRLNLSFSGPAATGSQSQSPSQAGSKQAQQVLGPLGFLQGDLISTPSNQSPSFSSFLSGCSCYTGLGPGFCFWAQKTDANICCPNGCGVQIAHPYLCLCAAFFIVLRFVLFCFC